MMSLVFVVPKHVALDSFATLRPALVLPLTAPLPSVSTRIRNSVNVEIHNAVLINIVYLFKTDVKHKNRKSSSYIQNARPIPRRRFSQGVHVEHAANAHRDSIAIMNTAFVVTEFPYSRCKNLVRVRYG